MRESNLSMCIAYGELGKYLMSLWSELATPSRIIVLKGFHHLPDFTTVVGGLPIPDIAATH
jgi:hypothetical protein